MADKNLAAITDALSQTFGHVVRKVLNTSAIGFAAIAAIAHRDGAGKNLAIAVELDGDSAETYADGADASSYTTNTAVPAVLQWGLYRGNCRVSKLAVDTAGSTQSPAGLIKLVGGEFVNKSRSISLKLGTDFYSGTGTNVMNGLDVALQDANTYAGLDRTNAAYAKWRANVIDPGAATAITKTLIRSDLKAIQDASGFAPTVALCSTAVWLKVAALFDSSVQHVISTDPVTGQLVMRGGVAMIDFDGCVFICDRLATANRIYYLSPETFNISTLPKVAVEEFGDSVIEMPLDSTAGQLPLNMHLEALARQGASNRFSAYCTIQMLCENPIANGIRLNVSTS